ncbi:hypothetical protein RclHR1_00690037 [Rhizophagus clarus]|uniref:Protein kinase domain-containing protein n=1 Tax=Rhizophagus clarus TaxID=94130 RepID=A0A2Z6SJS2_9GLOM|nr:hypothetical protein RclHR1_00690037 [Rhizophagus clarus]
MEKKPKNLWKLWTKKDVDKYQTYVTISTIDSTNESEGSNKRIVYMEDLEKRKKLYGICGECNEPGTGENWCQPCNAKRFKDNFKNWTSGNKDIDELIQQSQLNAVHWSKCLEWIPFEKFRNITFIAEGGFNINLIKNHLEIHPLDIVECYGLTQNPNTNEYMMVLEYCDGGNLRNYWINSKNYKNCKSKIVKLRRVTRGLLDIHNAGFIHKDFHSGNILHAISRLFISDLGLCQPANKQAVKEEGICGVLPYVAPEILRRHQYTKAADIYSFGIIMNEFLSEEIPFNDIPHDEFLAIQICKGHRPKISEDVPKLLADLIIKCWDAEIENRPTAKELYQLLKKWVDEIINIEGIYYSDDSDCSDDGDDSDDSDSENIENDSIYYSDDNDCSDDNVDDSENIENGKNSQNSEIYFQIKEYDKIRRKKFKNRSYKDESENIQTHPQAIYTSRLLNFRNLPKPINSSDLSSFQFNSDANYAIQSTSTNPISVQLSELELNEFW